MWKQPPIFFFLASCMILAIIGIASAILERSEAHAWGTSWTWETAQPKQYKLDAAGSDMRVYEWRLQGANDIICVALFGSEGNYGMQCRQTAVKGKAPKLGAEE